MGHPLAFEFADSSRRSRRGPDARVLHQLGIGVGGYRAEAGARLPPRARRGPPHPPDRARTGYHGVNFGGTAVGGVVGNRKIFGALVTGVDHMRHTHDLAKNAFSRGQPKHGAELADDLERLCALHDASTIAAVIVEPVAVLGGRAGAAGGLPAAAARDLRQARHPAHLRRGDHRPGGGWASPSARSISASCPTSSPPPRASPTARCRWARCSCASASTRPS